MEPPTYLTRTKTSNQHVPFGLVLRQTPATTSNDLLYLLQHIQVHLEFELSFTTTTIAGRHVLLLGDAIARGPQRTSTDSIVSNNLPAFAVQQHRVVRFSVSSGPLTHPLPQHGDDSETRGNLALPCRGTGFAKICCVQLQNMLRTSFVRHQTRTRPLIHTCGLVCVRARKRRVTLSLTPCTPFKSMSGTTAAKTRGVGFRQGANRGEKGVAEVRR